MKLIEIRRFVVQGDPVGKARPRFTAARGYAKAYTPKNTEDYEKKVKSSYLRVFADAEPFKYEVTVDIKAYFHIPPSYSKKKKRMIMEGNMHPAKKPDNDNILKIIQDALNGIAYTDDKIIVASREQKLYTRGPEGYVVITISGYEADD